MVCGQSVEKRGAHAKESTGTVQLPKYQFLKFLIFWHPPSPNMSEEVMEEKLVMWKLPSPLVVVLCTRKNFQVDDENMRRGNLCG